MSRSLAAVSFAILIISTLVVSSLQANASDPVWNCEGKCITNVIGTGFRNPGRAYEDALLTSNPSLQAAYLDLTTQCKALAKKFPGREVQSKVVLSYEDLGNFYNTQISARQACFQGH